MPTTYLCWELNKYSKFYRLMRNRSKIEKKFISFYYIQCYDIIKREDVHSHNFNAEGKSMKNISSFERK